MSPKTSWTKRRSDWRSEGKRSCMYKSLDVPPFDPVAIKSFLTRCIVKPQSEYLDANAAAEYLGISVKQLYTLVELRCVLSTPRPTANLPIYKGDARCLPVVWRTIEEFATT